MKKVLNIIQEVLRWTQFAADALELIIELLDKWDKWEKRQQTSKDK